MDDWKQRLSMVYSTNPDKIVKEENVTPQQPVPPAKQNLLVGIERKNRGGKTVTWIRGFDGTHAELDELCKKLKVKCGAGGAAKDGQIIIQGDKKLIVADLLKSWGYGVRYGT